MELTEEILTVPDAGARRGSVRSSCRHCSVPGLGQVPTGAAGALSLPLGPGASVSTPAPAAICPAHSPEGVGVSTLVSPPLTGGIKNQWTRAFLYPQEDGPGGVHKPRQEVPRD